MPSLDTFFDRAGVPSARRSSAPCWLAAASKRRQEQSHAENIFCSTVQDSGGTLDTLACEAEAIIEGNGRLIRGVDLELDSAEALRLRFAEHRPEKCAAQPPTPV